MNNLITMSCNQIDLEKQIVFRTNRRKRVRIVRCLRSIFCGLRFPIVGIAGSKFLS